MTNSARAASVGRAVILMRDDLDDDDMADNAKTRPKALPSANRSRLFPSPIRLRSQRASAGGMGDRMQAEQPPTAIVGPRKATTTTTTSSTPSSSALRPRVLLRSSPTRELPPNTMIASCEFRRSPGALASASSGLYSLTGLEVNGNSFFQRPDSPIVPLALQAAATSFYRRSSASPTSPITSTPSASMRRAVSAGVNAQLSVAAPPQIEQGFLDANKMVVVAPQPSGYLQRRNSSGSIKSKTRSHEHLDSEGRVAALEEKVRELEAVIGTPSASLTIPINGTLKGSYSYPRIQYAQLMSLSSFDGGRMAQELLDKDSEIDRLRHQLHKYNSRLEMRQIQFDEEVKHYRREAEQSKLQAAAVKSRLNEIEQECNILQDKVGHSERQRQISLTKAEERLAAQEKELQSLRQELEKASSAKNELDQLRRDLEWMELQNDALSTTLDCKEQEVQDLRTDILNKSSVADAIASESSTSFTSLRDSQSTPSLSNVSRLLEAQQSKVANCRYTVKCLVDTADKLCKGELPNINRLLGCPSESMSESEAEKGRNGELTSMKAVEGQMRQQDAKIAAVERDLDRLRQVFVDFYAKKMADEMANEQSCRVQ